MIVGVIAQSQYCITVSIFLSFFFISSFFISPQLIALLRYQHCSNMAVLILCRALIKKNCPPFFCYIFIDGHTYLTFIHHSRIIAHMICGVLHSPIMIMIICTHMEFCAHTELADYCQAYLKHAIPPQPNNKQPTLRQTNKLTMEKMPNTVSSAFPIQKKFI